MRHIGVVQAEVTYNAFVTCGFTAVPTHLLLGPFVHKFYEQEVMRILFAVREASISNIDTETGYPEKFSSFCLEK
jgi:hypothetical protein